MVYTNQTQIRHLVYTEYTLGIQSVYTEYTLGIYPGHKTRKPEARSQKPEDGRWVQEAEIRIKMEKWKTE